MAGVFHGALVAELTMGSLGVVLDAEVLDDDPSLGEGPELLPVQAFVPEAPVERLDEAVLPGTGRLDVDRLDLLLGQPPLEFFGDKLRTVVRADELGAPCCALADFTSEITSPDLRARSALNTWQSRVGSANTVSIRRAPPRIVASARKSQVHT